MPVLPANKSFAYRVDVQGLRGISALYIAIFHIWQGGISGGVDVFFVLSGYFLTLNFIRSRQQGKAFSVKSVLARFALRTWPQVLMVLACTLVALLFFYYVNDWRGYLKAIAASGFYLENLQLIRSATNYLDRPDTLNPVMHFWAVSITGQVYASWALLAGGAARLHRANPLKGLFLVVMAVSLLSFLWGLYLVASAPSVAYFEPLSRYWEFGVGAIAALLNARYGRSLPGMGLLGLLLVLSCGPCIGSRLDFPGWASLWPVAGAFCILLANEPANSIAQRILTHKWLVWVGNRGFGIYLWHWPIYAIYWQIMQRMPSPLAGCAIIALAMVLATLSARLSARVLAHPKFELRALMLGMGNLALICLLGIELINSYRPANLMAPSVKLADLDPQSLKSYWTKLHDQDCMSWMEDADLKTCVFNRGAKSGVIYAVGSSHIGHWLPALIAFGRQMDLQVKASTKAICNLADDDSDSGDVCSVWGRKMLDKLLKERPTYVFVIGTKVTYLKSTLLKLRQKAVSEQVPEPYYNAFARLTAAGIKVLAIRDTPHLGFDAAECNLRMIPVASPCWRKRAEVLPGPAEQFHFPAGTYFLDFTDLLCDKQRCPTLRDGQLIYNDSNHLSVAFVKRIASLFVQRLQGAINAPQRP